MPISRYFKDTVKARAMVDEQFRYGLLTESINSMLDGEVDVGRALLRDYINATIGFEKLATVTGKSPKSLMRMFSPSGNPTAGNLFSVIHILQQSEGVRLDIRTHH